MTHILIVYGTTDGHTRKIADVLAEDLRANLCSVDIVDAAGMHSGLSPEGYDGVIVAASVHIGDYQNTVTRWVRQHAPMLNMMPSAFLSVSLAVVERRAQARTEITGIMERFLERSGWRPTMTKMVAGALLYTRYGWLKRRTMKRIVEKAGGDSDTTHDYEYTDWNDLRDFAREFAGVASQGARAGGWANTKGVRRASDMSDSYTEQSLEGGMGVQMWLSHAEEVRPQFDLQEQIWDELRRMPEPEIEGVNVEVEEFVATLTGWVPSDPAKVHVQAVAEHVRGVVAVINELVVTG